MRTGASLVLLVLAGTVPCMAQTPPTNEDAVATQLAALNGKVERLIELLERYQEDRETDLLIKRIDLLQRRIAPGESSLRSAEGTLGHLRDQVVGLEAMLEDAREAREQALRDGDMETADGLRNEITHLERGLEEMQAQQNSVEQRIRRLEDDLAESRELLEDLDALLLERLERFR